MKQVFLILPVHSAVPEMLQSLQQAPFTETDGLQLPEPVQIHTQLHLMLPAQIRYTVNQTQYNHLLLIC